MKTSKLLDSGISGAFAGSIFNAFRRGKGGVPSGFTTGAIVCTLLQWASNEVRIARLQYISRASTGSVPVNSEVTGLIPSNLSLNQTPSEPPPSDPKSLIERVAARFGKKISDEDYLRRMKAERDSYILRIEELEKEIQKDNNR